MMIFAEYNHTVCDNILGYTLNENVLTSTKKVMFLPGFVCEFVCVFVCEQDNSKTYGRISMKFSAYI